MIAEIEFLEKHEDDLKKIVKPSQQSQLSVVSKSSLDIDISSDDEYEYDYDEDEDDDVMDAEYDYGDEDMDVVNDTAAVEENKFIDRSNEGGVIMMDAPTLIPVMELRAKSVAETLNISQAAAVPALRKCKWDKNRLMDSFFSDRDKFTKDAGIFHRCKDVGNDDAKTKKRDGGKFTCTICFDDDLAQNEIYAMGCGHEFCLECWSGYINAKFDDGPSCILVTCPDVKCTEIITEEEVKKITPQLLSTFISYQLRNFVEDKVTSRWCPGPDCCKIATLPNTPTIGDAGMGVLCQSCNTSFCLGCGDEPHKPLTCSDLVLWNEKFAKEGGGSESWILQNTKPCPKCRVRIEKNQGCNHMTCRHCKHEFCWICFGDWTSHNQCNRFDGEGGTDKERELQRNLHYFKRFHAHADGQKFAEDQLKEVQSKYLNIGFESTKDGKELAVIENLKVPLIKANEQLVQCRRTLKNTYIYAYHHLHKTTETNSELLQSKDNIRTEQFEYHQEMLERFTEELSGLTEKPLDDIEKLTLVNKAEAVKKFMNRINDYVIEEMY
jgi:ariadne-1